MVDSSPILLILPAYNEAAALPPLLATVAATRGNALPNLRVIVVDDGSRDKTAQVVRDFDSTGVKLVQHPRNMGFAQAMRTGIAADTPHRMQYRRLTRQGA